MQQSRCAHQPCFICSRWHRALTCTACAGVAGPQTQKPRALTCTACVGVAGALSPQRALKLNTSVQYWKLSGCLPVKLRPQQPHQTLKP